MTKAILIDVEKKEVTEVVRTTGIDEIHKYLKCECFTGFGLQKGALCYYDDEGLINGTTEGFRFPDFVQTVMGNGLIVGLSPDGEDADSPLTLEEVKSLVTFFDYDNVEDIPVPPTQVISFDNVEDMFKLLGGQ